MVLQKTDQEMPRSILVNLEENSGYSFIYCTLPLTKPLLEVIRKILKVLEENKEFYDISVPEEIVQANSFPSLQYERTFQNSPLLPGEYAILKYSLRAIDKISCSIVVNRITLRLEVMYQGMLYGSASSTGVEIPLEKILK